MTYSGKGINLFHMNQVAVVRCNLYTDRLTDFVYALTRLPCESGGSGAVQPVH